MQKINYSFGLEHTKSPTVPSILIQIPSALLKYFYTHLYLMGTVTPAKLRVVVRVVLHRVVLHCGAGV